MSSLSIARWKNGFCQHWLLWLSGFPWFIKTFSPASMWLKLSLTCISLMINDVEHLHIPIGHLMSWEKCLSIIFHWIFFFLLLLNCMNSFYILDINSLLNICFANVFSHFIDCLFILLFPLLYRSKIDVVSLIYLFFFTSQLLRWPLPKSQN